MADAFDELWADLDDRAKASVEERVRADIGRHGLERLSPEELNELRRNLTWAYIDPAGYLKARRRRAGGR